MRKVKFITALVIIGVLVIPLSVFAATSDTTAAKTVRGFFGIDTSKFTTQQKADAADYSKKVADIQKEFIDKMVQNGSMTKKDGDTAKQKIDDSYKASQENGGLYGIMPGKGMGSDFGRKGGFGKSFADTSKLTDEQKADISATVKKIDALTDQQEKDVDDYSQKLNVLRKELVDKYVSAGVITQDQGTEMLQRMEQKAGSKYKEGFGKGMKMKGKGRQ